MSDSFSTDANVTEMKGKNQSLVKALSNACHNLVAANQVNRLLLRATTDTKLVALPPWAYYGWK